MTHSCNRDKDLNKKACQSMLDVFILDFQKILGTLLRRDTKIHRQVTSVYWWFASNIYSICEMGKQ